MSSLILLSSSANILNVETMLGPGVWCDEDCFPLNFMGLVSTFNLRFLSLLIMNCLVLKHHKRRSRTSTF